MDGGERVGGGGDIVPIWTFSFGRSHLDVMSVWR